MVAPTTLLFDSLGTIEINCFFDPKSGTVRTDGPEYRIMAIVFNTKVGKAHKGCALICSIKNAINNINNLLFW